jgi:hypothetical protein
VVVVEDGEARLGRKAARSRDLLLGSTSEADWPAWATPTGTPRPRVRRVARGGDPARRAAERGAAAAEVADAKNVRIRDGKAQLADGPAVQAPEQLGGYDLVDCKDLEQALELAAKIPGAQYGTIGVRPVLEHP